MAKRRHNCSGWKAFEDVSKARDTVVTHLIQVDRYNEASARRSGHLYKKLREAK